MSSDRWYAPFTREQVIALNEYQDKGLGHPYMCPEKGNGHFPLEATEEGWRCADKMCLYRQAWAHAMTLTLRHYLIAAGLPGHHYIARDGSRCYTVHSDADAADRAMAAFHTYHRDSRPSLSGDTSDEHPDLAP